MKRTTAPVYRSILSRFLFLLMISCFLFTTARSQDKQEDKITAATQVLKDFGDMKESIPADLLKVTQGIIIVPRLLNGGFVLAAKRGKGIAMVRLPDGSWSNPVFVTITGGSVGFQAGIQSVDLVLIFRKASTLENIGKGSFTLGGEISATAGPVGRNSTASTDYKMEAEVYSYSRSKGLFAGISLSGSAISVDSRSNQAFYGKDLTSGELFSNDSDVDSESVTDLKNTLEQLYQDAG